MLKLRLEEIAGNDRAAFLAPMHGNHVILRGVPQLRGPANNPAISGLVLERPSGLIAARPTEVPGVYHRTEFGMEYVYVSGNVPKSQGYFCSSPDSPYYVNTSNQGTLVKPVGSEQIIVRADTFMVSEGDVIYMGLPNGEHRIRATVVDVWRCIRNIKNMGPRRLSTTH